MTRFRGVFLLSVVFLFFSFLGSADAETLSPWFHLASISRPSNLGTHPEPGQSEVQTITAAPGSVFELQVEKKPAGLLPGFTGFPGVFEAEPYPGPFGGAVPNATAANVQVSLEAVYGAGNVVVEEGPGGVHPLIVKSVGVDADRPVPPIEIGTVYVPEAKAEVTTQGLSAKDGTIAMTAINVGDATYNGCVKVAPKTGKWTNSECNVEASPSGEGEYEKQFVTVTGKLPKGVRAVSVTANSLNNGSESRGPVKCEVKSAQNEVRCTFGGTYEEEILHNGNFEKFIVVPETLPPYEQIEAVISVDLEPGASSGELDEVGVSGGGVPSARTTHPLTVAGAPGEATPFGAETYEQSLEEAGGAPAVQAGKHPFQFTTTLNLNENAEAEPAALAKDLTFELPPGLIGDPSAYPQCTLSQFTTVIDGRQNQCPAGSVLGVAVLSFQTTHGKPGTSANPIFNLEPSPGEAARFGFQPASLPVFLGASVRTGQDYGVTVHVRNITQTAGFVANTVTFWGVPGKPEHDNARDNNCLLETDGTTPEGLKQLGLPPCLPLQQSSPPPFLTLPTSCTGELHSTVQGDSWVQAGAQPVLATTPMGALDGCGYPQFGAEIKVSPDVQSASSPSGLKVDVHVPQTGALNPEGLAPADVRNITVALPAGVHVNPSASDGLEACSEGLVGFERAEELSSLPGFQTNIFTPRLPGSIPALEVGEEGTLQPGVNFCPDASKIGTVKITTPLLPKGQNVEGFVYLASQEQNPFGSLMALYIVAEDKVSGTLVKLPGELRICQGAGEVIDGVACQALGQLITTVKDNPQLPFEDAELHFFGGERAPLATPTRCGFYTTSATFEPWTNGGLARKELHSTATFPIATGPKTLSEPGGSPCPGASLPFSPTLTGGGENVNAGAFSPFTATMSRLSGEQNLQSLEVHLPPGLSGILSNIELCPEPQANLGECGPNSLIGETTVAVGVGGEPYTVSGGKFYLTGPYNGTGACTVSEPGCAPFGITFRVPAKAGPFDLANTQHNHPACDCVLVRGKIEIDPITAAVTITSNPPGTPDSIPTSIEGIPLEIQHVNAVTTRSNFQFNPTNCSKMEVTGTIHSSEGGTDTIGVPFQVTNCKNLNFAPKFTVFTSAKTSRTDGASLSVKLTYPSAPFGSQANIGQVKVELPKGLPSRLQTLQKACTAAQFHANPAGCPAASIVGHAKAITPLVPVSLEGPAYFVSNGGEAFPNLIVVLQGYNVTIDLVGDTFISKAGVTSSTFKTVPDAPVGSFELNLPEGPYSALTTDGNLCKQKLAMPTELVAQNGAQIKQSTKIEVQGCGKAKKAHHQRKKHHRKKKTTRRRKKK